MDILQVTRPVVEELSKKYKLVLVSNFYGNIQTILKDFGLLDFFDEIIESFYNCSKLNCRLDVLL